MATKHTPGKWRYDNNKVKATVKRTGHTVSFKEVILADALPVDYRDRDEHLHNVKLMASAPELLDMLRTVLNCAELNQECLEHETIDMIAHAQTLVNRFEY